MPETKRCTCIKPIVISGQRLSIGEQIDLVENQYRPLQNGGFVTLDDAAGELIRDLIREDDEPDADIDVLEAEDVSAEPVSEIYSTTPASTHKPQPVGYELGD